MVKSFVNYAHRGASEYVPENTMLAFYLGIYMGANGIETDVQLTKDGVMVLFHDDTMERMCHVSGGICDYTYQQLQSFYVSKNGFLEKIPTLDEFLRSFHFRPLTFAVELKNKGTAKLVAEALREYKIEDKTVVTSFLFDELTEFKKYAPEFRVGYLTNQISEELLSQMKKVGMEEICPEAKMVDCEAVKKWHDMGFGVRAWGVYNEVLMKAAYDAGCDGMTVNFPDKLEEYRKNKI